jgi:hypothetical protein
MRKSLAMLPCVTCHVKTNQMDFRSEVWAEGRVLESGYEKSPASDATVHHLVLALHLRATDL